MSFMLILFSSVQIRPHEAFLKAEQLGRDSEDSYLNPNNQTVTFTYRGLRNLLVIYEELEHGAELMFEEEVGMSEDELQKMLTPKSQLAVFDSDQPIDPSRPDYSSKEIMDECTMCIEKRKYLY